MQCPVCQHNNSRVLESRAAESNRSIRRRRECLSCQHRFTTYERVEFVPITVIKRDGKRESFDRSKLLRGLVRACEKSGIASTALDQIVDEIEVELQQRSNRDISSQEIGELVLAQLKAVNEVAYVRFASVYRQFTGIRDFVDALAQLKNSQTHLNQGENGGYPSEEMATPQIVPASPEVSNHAPDSNSQYPQKSSSRA